jgi:hypothetical protein
MVATGRWWMVAMTEAIYYYSFPLGVLIHNTNFNAF